MFKGKNAEIDMLLTGLLVLSALIGGLHHRSLGAEQKIDSNKVVTLDKQDAQNPLADVPADEIFINIQPLIMSNSVEKIIKVLTGVPFNSVSLVLKKILDTQEANLNRDDRIAIIVGLAAQYKKQEESYGILDLIIAPQYGYLREGAPILAIAASTDYPYIIPIIKAWYANRVAQQANHADLCAKLESRALIYAVRKNKLDELKAMMSNGVAIDNDRMSKLFVAAVKRRTGCDIIKFLLEQGADINYVAKGHTALIWAIKNHDLKAVKFLVQHGADVNKIGDNAVGNPRQVAGEAVEQAAAANKKDKKSKKDKNLIQAQKDAVEIESYLIAHKADN